MNRLIGAVALVGVSLLVPLSESHPQEARSISDWVAAIKGEQGGRTKTHRELSCWGWDGISRGERNSQERWQAATLLSAR